MIPLSLLDLAPIVEGGDAASALASAVDVARHAEGWGYRRVWYAEHHNMPGVASAATAIVIGHVAACTTRIRVGAGGIMLPNHAPLVIAEQFGTLASLFPGRIDSGIGRAPGTNQLTARALRRNHVGSVDGFADDLIELMGYLDHAPPATASGPGGGTRTVRAIPGTGTRVPIYILGSSLYGAQLAAGLGLPFAFASHFAPALLDQAIDIYRSLFRPSAELPRPQVMLGVNVIAADSDDQARGLLTSLQQVFLQLRRGQPGPLPRPRDAEAFAADLHPDERAILGETLACTFAGAPDTVRRGLDAFIARTGADELIITAHIHDHRARLRSLELTAALGGLGTAGMSGTGTVVNGS